jgi:DNA-binding ferritin-like protein
MTIQRLQTTLTEVFGSNFVAYYRSHSAHINVVGRSFYQDHKLLQKIYEYFQDNIDMLGEKLRTIRAMAPDSIGTILDNSLIPDLPTQGDADDLLQQVLDIMDPLIDQYHELEMAANAVDYTDISNFAQDQIARLAKFRWQLESTLEIESTEQSESDSEDNLD